MALQKLPLLELIEHLDPLNPCLFALLVEFLLIYCIHAYRVNVKSMEAFGSEKVYHTLFLCISRRTIVDSKKLAASILQILYHHSSELIIGVNHLIVDEGRLRSLSKEIYGPVKYTLSIFRSHVD